jgi:hypothetical protein
LGELLKFGRRLHYMDGRYRMGASAVGPDQGAGGTGVGQRLVPEEPMSNLGISRESFLRSLGLELC